MKKLKSKRLKMVLTAAALLEVILLACSVTFSWMEGGTQGKIDGESITVSAGSSLIMTYNNAATSAISIPACSLEEASSADGRSFFFPLDSNTSNQTSNMTFRRGTAADVNKKYISLDFELTSTGGAADVYLGAGTVISANTSGVLSALRMSFSTNDGSDPKVFAPAQMPGVSGARFAPVTAVDNGGRATTGTQITKAFGDYYYKGENAGNSLFTIESNQTKQITLTIWLEGTAFEGNTIADQGVNIYIDFSTTVDELVKYNFQDNTHGYTDPCDAEYWITNKQNYDSNEHDTMMYIYDKTSQRYYAMQKSDNYSTDHTWYAYVPSTISDFSFRRYSIDIDEWWNEWTFNYSDIKTDPNGEKTYVAICGTANGANGTNLTPCGGYWKDQDGTYRVYFQTSNSWSRVFCYADDNKIGAWPGVEITSTKTTRTDNNTNYSFYYYDIKESDNINFVIFNNGSSGVGNQSQECSNLFNGAAFYYQSSNVLGSWLYTEKTNSMIFK